MINTFMFGKADECTAFSRSENGSATNNTSGKQSELLVTFSFGTQMILIDALVRFNVVGSHNTCISSASGDSFHF